MKKIFLFALCVSIITGCYNEKDLTPSDVSVVGKFEFPQEGTPADVQDVLDEIYETYGVKVIYKDFTEADFRRSWTSPSGSVSMGAYEWDILSGDDLLEAAETLRDKVFGLMPVEIVKEGTKSMPYIYLVDNLRTMTRNNTGQLVEEVVQTYPVRAMDALVVNLQINAPADSYQHKVFYPVLTAFTIFDGAFTNGAITLPESFYEVITTIPGPDMKTYNNAIGVTDYPKFWARQGVPPRTNPSNGRISMGKHTGAPSYISGHGNLVGKYVQVPFYFMLFCVDTHWREHFDVQGVLDYTLRGVFYDCPKLKERYYTFYNEMKAQGIDFDVIQQKLYAGTNVNTDLDYVYVRDITPVANAYKYHYEDFNNN